MNTHIRNAEARKFWEAVYLQDVALYEEIDSARFADCALVYWASRFADEETLQDIEANKARRELGNKP